MLRSINSHFAVCLFVFGVGFASVAQAVTIYATSYEGQAIYKCDTVTNTNTLVHSTASAGNPDSLLFDPAGRIIYSATANGTIHSYNPVGNLDTTLAFASNPVDLALDPSGTTFLVSDIGSPSLTRIPVAGGAPTLLVNGSYDGGIAYANANLFAIANHTEVDQLNPTTGALLNSSIPNALLDLDGMTYDPLTQHLWATDLNNGSLVEFDPAALTYSVHALPSYFGGSLEPDGIISDGAGTLYFASRKAFSIYSYDIATATITAHNQVFGVDDLAPIIGPGSLESVPEPASLVSLAVGAALLLRRRNRI
ncbi:MAG: PEP-CTERM sorting domain-containing protein [Tepidisphaeraceae bacterium]|jgi:sugar lactone lactonase YvrE